MMQVRTFERDISLMSCKDSFAFCLAALESWFTSLFVNKHFLPLPELISTVPRRLNFLMILLVVDLDIEDVTCNCFEAW